MNKLNSEDYNNLKKEIESLFDRYGISEDEVIELCDDLSKSW